MVNNLTDVDKSISRTSHRIFLIQANGLRPNTKHKLYLDGVEHTFAARQLGKDFGDDLISDQSGRIDLEYLMQFNFNRDQNFELPEQQTLSYRDSVLNTQRSNRVVKNYVLVEIKSADGQSYAQHVRTINRILTQGPVRTLYPVD